MNLRKPFHLTIASSLGAIAIATDTQLQSIGALGFAAGLIASTDIPNEPDLVFAAFSDKTDELIADKNIDTLIMFTETVGDKIKTHIGDMDLPKATFFKDKLDELRDKVAHLAPGDMHKVEHAIFAVGELAERIRVLTPPADDADLAVDKSPAGQQEAGTGQIAEQAQA